MLWLWVGMVVVIACFFALALTTPRAGEQASTAARKLAVALWVAVIVAGWIAFAYLAFAAPGGLDAAWSWVRAQLLLVQIAMWLFLLPWMIGLWLWQTSLAPWMRVLLIAGLALGTLLLSWRPAPPPSPVANRGERTDGD